jgi:hypothetical protein
MYKLNFIAGKGPMATHVCRSGFQLVCEALLLMMRVHVYVYYLFLLLYWLNVAAF